MAQRPSILIATGGSGGHLTPALAVATELERCSPGCELHFTTTSREIERRMLAAAGRTSTVLPLLPSAELKRHPWRWYRSWRESVGIARRLVQSAQPGCVIGTGGLSMAPTVREAFRQNIPVILLEQNAVPGRATRWLSRRAAVVCSGFRNLTPPLPNPVRIEWTGNPLRPEIADLFTGARRTEGRLLVLGGSQGALGLNQALKELAITAADVLQPHGIIHQTGGEESAAELRSVYAAAGIPAVVQPFFDDMAAVYRQASLVIARAGATTLAELTSAGLPAILVPYPYARDQHQNANAVAFEQAGAAIAVPQGESAAITSARLRQVLSTWEPARAESMAKSMRALAKPDAARSVAGIVLNLAQPSSQ